MINKHCEYCIWFGLNPVTKHLDEWFADGRIKGVFSDNENIHLANYFVSLKGDKQDFEYKVTKQVYNKLVKLGVQTIR